MIKKHVSVFVLIFIFGVCSVFASDIEDKRQKFRNAMNKGILSIYDIDFSTYVQLEMWEEIERIFRANLNNTAAYTFSNAIYSRPYFSDNKIWIFENSKNKDNGVHLLDPETLQPINHIANHEFSEYDGGIRIIVDHTVISAGSPNHLETIVFWNTKSNNIKTIRLESGQYITSLKFFDGLLYVGSCGGKISVWNMSKEDLEYSRTFSSADSLSNKECITDIFISDNKIYGIGNETVYIWNSDSTLPVGQYEKLIPNGSTEVYKNTLIEYRDSFFSKRDLENGQIIQTVELDQSIAELIVTDETIFNREFEDILIISLFNNQGFIFYDFRSLNPFFSLQSPGQSVSVFNNKLYTCPDRQIILYSIVDYTPSKFEKFLQTIDIDAIPLTNDNYGRLLGISRLFPSVLDPNKLTENYLKSKQFVFRHYLKSDISSNQSELSKDMDKRNTAVYEIQNLSVSYYFVMMGLVHGNTGQNDSETQSYFLPPNSERSQGHFSVTALENNSYVIYPIAIQEISQAYYEEFMAALNGDNPNIEIIDKYLGDHRVRQWHPALKERRERLKG